MYSSINNNYKRKHTLQKITLTVILVLIFISIKKQDTFQLKTYQNIIDGNTPYVSFSLHTNISEILNEYSLDKPIAFIAFTVGNKIPVSKEKYIRMMPYYKLLNIHVNEVFYLDEGLKIDVNKKVIFAALCNYASDDKFKFEKGGMYLSVIINKTYEGEILSNKFDVFGSLGGRAMTYEITEDGNYIYANSGNFEGFTEIPLSDEERELLYVFKADKDVFIDDMLLHIKKYRR